MTTATIPMLGVLAREAAAQGGGATTHLPMEALDYVPSYEDTDPSARRLVAHRIRPGESLADIAASLGITWEELARLNWGVDTEESVGWHLHLRVGAAEDVKPTTELTGRELPGIIRVPRPLEPKRRRRRRAAARVCRYPVE